MIRISHSLARVAETLLVVCIAAVSHAEAPTAVTSPLPVIFDTDITGDCDDVLALAMLHALADRGECRIGLATPFPRESIARDFTYKPQHIVREAYLLHSGPHHDRPSWDLTRVLVAVRPLDAYFDLSPPGRVIEGQRALASQPPRT